MLARLRLQRAVRRPCCGRRLRPWSSSGAPLAPASTASRGPAGGGGGGGTRGFAASAPPPRPGPDHTEEHEEEEEEKDSRLSLDDLSEEELDQLYRARTALMVRGCDASMRS